MNTINMTPFADDFSKFMPDFYQDMDMSALDIAIYQLGEADIVGLAVLMHNCHQPIHGALAGTANEVYRVARNRLATVVANANFEMASEQGYQYNGVSMDHFHAFRNQLAKEVLDIQSGSEVSDEDILDLLDTLGDDWIEDLISIGAVSK